MFIQKELRLKPRTRGFHLITDEVNKTLPEITKLKIGMLSVHIKHTSAGLCLNENADPTVREDFESFFNKLVPENIPYFKHTYEGSDDMPAHIKAALVGSSINIPISDMRMNLGTWQGIYLCEFRDHGGSRSLILTLQGE